MKSVIDLLSIEKQEVVAAVSVYIREFVLGKEKMDPFLAFQLGTYAGNLVYLSNLRNYERQFESGIRSDDLTSTERQTLRASEQMEKELGQEFYDFCSEKLEHINSMIPYQLADWKIGKDKKTKTWCQDGHSITMEYYNQ